MHKQAAVNTMKFVGGAIAVAVLTVLMVEFLTFELTLKIVGSGFLAYFIYMFYSIEKSRLEASEKFEQLNKEMSK
jgi:multisubunit Na+/H+ antiporter MnhE subunit